MLKLAQSKIPDGFMKPFDCVMMDVFPAFFHCRDYMNSGVWDVFAHPYVSLHVWQMTLRFTEHA